MLIHWFAATSGPVAGSASALVSARSSTNSELAKRCRSTSVTGAASRSNESSDSVQAACMTPFGLRPAKTGPTG